MGEKDIARREQELELAEKNLHTMKEIVFMEHQTQTQTIKKVTMQVLSELTEKGHVCVNGERFARLEGKLDTIIENQGKFETAIDKLYEGRNSNSKRIDRIETIGGMLVTVIIASWAVFIWLAEKVIWK